MMTLMVPCTMLFGYRSISFIVNCEIFEDRPMFLHQVRVVKRGFMNVGREPSLLSLTRSTLDENELVRAVNSFM